MQLRNKKTGEIIEFNAILPVKDVAGDSVAHLEYGSLAELNEEWEDYEEPKEHWCITMYGGITRIKDDEEPIDDLIEIGNYFNSKEDAYDALGKLKAWKRLKDNSWKPVHYNIATREASVIFSTGYTITEQDRKDLDICFGGEE